MEELYVSLLKKNGYIKEVFIERIWLKNKFDYLELFELINEKVTLK